MTDRDVRYPPIGDYGMIGDLRSAALLSKHGSIDWMCLPRFDSLGYSAGCSTGRRAGTFSR